MIQKSALEKEKEIVHAMIKMYCKNFHVSNEIACQECTNLATYAETRLKNCKYGEEKPTCANCPIHCYKPDMREQIKKVMRYSGPRMMYTHPIMGFRYLFKKFKKAKNFD
ncbi:MAG: nitrous oxide-stimulated promoter family protein [Promethearchaeota archaeon]|jgi:hypothetical protein